MLTVQRPHILQFLQYCKIYNISIDLRNYVCTIYHLFIIKKNIYLCIIQIRSLHVLKCNHSLALTAFDHLVPWRIQKRCSWSERLYFELRPLESGYLHESPMQGTLNISVNVPSRQNNDHTRKKKDDQLPEFCHWNHISLQPLFEAWQTLNLFQPPQAEMPHCKGSPEKRNKSEAII